jgi:hypothetical protein
MPGIRVSWIGEDPHERVAVEVRVGRIRAVAARGAHGIVREQGHQGIEVGGRRAAEDHAVDARRERDGEDEGCEHAPILPAARWSG